MIHPKINLASEKLSVKFCAQLFWAFMKFGIVTFGGGTAMIPLLQGIVVEKYDWLTEDECIDCIAVSQALPGVIAINLATYVGYKKQGLIGAICATVGVLIPSVAVIMAAVAFLDQFGGNRFVHGALKGVSAATIGLMACAVYTISRKVLKGPFSVMLAAGAFCLITFLHWNAVWPIVIAILSGLFYEYVVVAKKIDGEAEDKK